MSVETQELSAFALGIVLLVAAILGGGFAAFGFQVPVISSKTRQVLLGILAVGLILYGKWDLIEGGGEDEEDPQRPTPNLSQHDLRALDSGELPTLKQK